MNFTGENFQTRNNLKSLTMPIVTCTLTQPQQFVLKMKKQSDEVKAKCDEDKAADSDIFSKSNKLSKSKKPDSETEGIANNFIYC